MIITVPRWVLFGYAGNAIFFPFILVAKDAYFKNVVINHEKIHQRQIIECLIVPFYVIYLINYFVNLFKYKKHSEAYRNIIFEREAYKHEMELGYLEKRKLYAWLKK